LQGTGAALLAGCAGNGRGSSDTHGPNDTDGPTSPTLTAPLGRPIIYLFVDQLRWDAIGVAGNPVVPTPHIDAIAADAVRFSTCITNGPSCRAARASMMTGLQVYRHGITDNFLVPDPNAQSHVRRLRDEAGYHTMVVGKTHLVDAFGGHLDDKRSVLQAFGFSDSVELPDPQMVTVQSAHSDYLTATTPEGEEDKYQRWRDYVLNYVWDSAAPDTAPWNLSTADHLDSFCARTTADYIRSYAEDKPLYLQVNFPGPHKPFDPTTEYLSRVDPNDPRMPLPILVFPQEPIAPLVQEWGIDKFEEWTETTARQLRQSYYGKIALVDAGIGEVVAALQETGLWDEAWIIVHSDHGELAADHMMTGKVVAFEGAIRVPLIVRPPGGLSAWVDDGQVDQMDVTATLLALSGLDHTGYGDRSLVDRVVAGPEGPEAHATKVVLFENLSSVGIRTETHKITYDLGLERPVEYYDLVADPQEIVNRVLDPEVATQLDELMGELTALRPLPA
jgi:arylsulfatase A-like enzyme